MNDIVLKLEEHSVVWKKNTICKKMVYADELTIFPEERKVAVNGNDIFFTYHEFDLLCFLASHQHQAFTKEQIYEAVWDDIPISVNAKVMCMISNIRHKLRAYSKSEYIHTIWGVGYKFEPKT